MLLTVGGADPSLRNWGLAKALYDTDTGDISMTGIRLQSTEIETGKTVRKSSDYLRRAGLLTGAMHLWINDCAAVFAEIPTGSQSASGAMSNGICVGVMSSVGMVGQFRGSLIQVDPSEVKRAACGSKNASKDEMIEWAMGLYPHLPWPMHNKKPMLKCEHMADACAAIHAGVVTNEFRSIVQILRVTEGQAQNLGSSAILQ